FCGWQKVRVGSRELNWWHEHGQPGLGRRPASHPQPNPPLQHPRKEI
ncbi:uncharacterized protein METZ01_LOCUS157408, partial [marine metagenome]